MLRIHRFRFGMKWMIAVVAIVAVLLGAWDTYFNPVREWKRTIRDEDGGIARWEAIGRAAQGSIEGLDPIEAVAELVAALDDPDFHVRQDAALGLGQFGRLAEPAVPALAAALVDRDLGVRMYAADSLGEILKCVPVSTAEAAIPSLIAALSDPFDMVKLKAAATLARIGEIEQAAELLLEFARAEDAFSATTALWSLCRTEHGATLARPLLLELAQSDNRFASDYTGRYYALWAAGLLYKIGERDISLEVLARGVNSDSVLERREVANILRWYCPDLRPEQLLRAAFQDSRS